MWRAISRNADVVVLGVACCFGAGLFLAWAANGFTWSSPERPVAARTNAVPSTHETPARPRPQPIAHRSKATLTLLAAGGPAWVSLHADSPSGKTLYEGLLARRTRITITEPRIAARFQASSNLVAEIGGRRADLGRYELRNVLITRAGIRVLAAAPHTGKPAVIAS